MIIVPYGYVRSKTWTRPLLLHCKKCNSVEIHTAYRIERRLHLLFFIPIPYFGDRYVQCDRCRRKIHISPKEEEGFERISSGVRAFRTLREIDPEKARRILLQVDSEHGGAMDDVAWDEVRQRVERELPEELTVEAAERRLTAEQKRIVDNLRDEQRVQGDQRKRPTLEEQWQALLKEKKSRAQERLAPHRDASCAAAGKRPGVVHHRPGLAQVVGAAMWRKLILAPVCLGIVVGIYFVFWGLPSADNGSVQLIAPTPPWEQSVQPIAPTPPWQQGDCARLEALFEDPSFSTACFQEVGVETYEARQAHWEYLIANEDLSAEEAIAGFSAWLAEQGENCRIWADIITAHNRCP